MGQIVTVLWKWGFGGASDPFWALQGLLGRWFLQRPQLQSFGFHGYRKAKERLMGIRQVGKQSSLLPPRFRHLSRIQAPEVFTILW